MLIYTRGKDEILVEDSKIKDGELAALGLHNLMVVEEAC